MRNSLQWRRSQQSFLSPNSVKRSRFILQSASARADITAPSPRKGLGFAWADTTEKTWSKKNSWLFSGKKGKTQTARWKIIVYNWWKHSRSLLLFTCGPGWTILIYAQQQNAVASEKEANNRQYALVLQKSNCGAQVRIYTFDCVFLESKLKC